MTQQLRDVDPLQRMLFDDGAAASAPSAPGLEAFTDQSFDHPASARRIRLAGHWVGYALTRARRHSIGMLVGREGLSVRAPRWVTSADIESALQARSHWIVKHLKEQRARHVQALRQRVVWCDGTVLNVLGRACVVELDDRLSGVALEDDDSAGGPSVYDTDRVADDAARPRTLRVGVPLAASPETIRDAVHAWLQRHALATFETRCAHFAPQLGVTVKRLLLSAARTRWGSATADGVVRLNWRLVHQDMACIDYVVVHELSHLRHMNHGPAFWATVGSVLPDFAQARSVLRQRGADIVDDT